MKKVPSYLLFLGGFSCSVNGGGTLYFRDPVCGVTCSGEKCEQETTNGKAFYSCAEECERKLDRNPEVYIKVR